MARVYLVHWNESELHHMAASLRAVGHDVRGHFAQNKAPSWDDFPADVAAISLERLPAHGREIADWILSVKKRRHVPVVFIGGKPEKVADTKTRFPEAVYCSAAKLGRTIEALASGKLVAPVPEERVKTLNAKRPSATPLARKLGVVAGSRFALVDAPRGFLKLLAAPDGAIQKKLSSPECDVVVLFARDARQLSASLKEHRNRLGPKSSLWLAWPKRTSSLSSDLTDEVVRQMGLRSGLVDVKVCAIDDDWSGLKFMVRVADRPTERVMRIAKK